MFREDPRDRRRTCSTVIPTGASAWRRGKQQAEREQPHWTVMQPEVDDISTGGQKYSAARTTARSWRRAMRRRRHRVKLTVKTDLQKVTAFRLELLNDPNLPLGGPGRSIKGTGALTEFEVEAAPAETPEEAKMKIASATADVNLPETPLDRDVRRQDGKRSGSPGRSTFAIDGKDETAWGIDAGPGRRNQPRKAVFTLAKPIASLERSLTIYLNQKHGGWNSDDNQNNNLGRLRLSVTTDARRRCRPAAHERSRSARHARDERTPAQDADRVQLLADDGPGMEGGERHESRRCGSSTRRARRNWCCTAREVRADAYPEPRRLPETRRSRCAGRAVRSCIRCRRMPQPTG